MLDRFILSHKDHAVFVLHNKHTDITVQIKLSWICTFVIMDKLLNVSWLIWIIHVWKNSMGRECHDWNLRVKEVVKSVKYFQGVKYRMFLWNTYSPNKQHKDAWNYFIRNTGCNKVLSLLYNKEYYYLRTKHNYVYVIILNSRFINFNWWMLEPM